MNEITEIRIDEHGDEEHESWLLIGASHISSTPGVHLFDSDIDHQHFVRVRINRATRKRNLNRDWMYPQETLLEMDMSLAQWGAFVSSFGNGIGVPATLSWFGKDVPSAPFQSRLDESHKEVRAAAGEAIEKLKAAHAELQSAFDEKAGRKVMAEKLKSLQWALQGTAPGMEFVAKSMTEHVEKVVAHAKADIEAMVLDAQAGYSGQLEETHVKLLEQTKEES